MMPCRCRIEEVRLNDIGPYEQCVICSQKHFLAARAAINEPDHGIKEKNHDFAIGELVLAAMHIRQDFPALAQKIRDIRHYVQYWQYDKIGDQWDAVAHALNTEIIKILPAPSDPAKSPTGPTITTVRAPGKIYVFSNVKYPEKNKIHPAENDTLVFLNRAQTIGFYPDHKKKIVYHRSPKRDYGELQQGAINRYVFATPDCIPKKFIDELKKTYDWNYPIEEGKVKCMTTGYMVVMWLHHLYPDREIVLVNFGYDVKKSTYRCPYHNWQFEAEQLKAFTHIYLEE